MPSPRQAFLSSVFGRRYGCEQETRVEPVALILATWYPCPCELPYIPAFFFDTLELGLLFCIAIVACTPVPGPILAHLRQHVAIRHYSQVGFGTVDTLPAHICGFGGFDNPLLDPNRLGCIARRSR